MSLAKSLVPMMCHSVRCLSVKISFSVPVVSVISSMTPFDLWFPRGPAVAGNQRVHGKV